MPKTRNATRESLEHEVQSALKWLKSHSTKATLDGMARYALPSDKEWYCPRDRLGRCPKVELKSSISGRYAWQDGVRPISLGLTQFRNIWLASKSS